MTKPWHEIKQDFVIAVEKQVGKREAESLFRLLFEYFTGDYSMSSELMNTYPSQLEYDEFLTFQQRIINQEPIQYILGQTLFYDLPLRVNPSVLIPRQETEELVDWVIKDSKNLGKLAILDIGTGSGAIALSLAKNLPESVVIGIDVSEEAVITAQQNKEQNQLANASFEVLDMHELQNQNNHYDVIVSNPPYIDPNDQHLMEQNVLAHEPKIALFAPENSPLYFYQLIADFAKHKLNENGSLYFEINEFYLEELVTLLESKGFHYIEPRKDLNGFWRMLKAKI